LTIKFTQHAPSGGTGPPELRTQFHIRYCALLVPYDSVVKDRFGANFAARNLAPSSFQNRSQMLSTESRCSPFETGTFLLPPSLLFPTVALATADELIERLHQRHLGCPQLNNSVLVGLYG